MAARHCSELELLQFDDSFPADVRLNEPMSRHTTYRIGGPAHAYVEAQSVGSVAMKILHGVRLARDQTCW